LRELPGEIERLEGRLSALTSDGEVARAHAGDWLLIGGRPTARSEAVVRLGSFLEGLPDSVADPVRFPIGKYRGLDFGLVLHPRHAPEVYLEGSSSRREGLTREHQGPRAVLNALERLASGYEGLVERLSEDLAIARGQLRDYEDRSGRPFGHEGYRGELERLRDGLKVALSAVPGGPETPGMADAATLAAAIRSLKEGEAIEAPSVRAVSRGVSTAEVPVTTRIREGWRSVPCPSLSVGEDLAPESRSASVGAAVGDDARTPEGSARARPGVGRDGGTRR
jgi:hypothetical protein